MSCLSLARAVKHVLQESQGQVPHPGTSGDKIPAQRSRGGPADTPEGSSTPAQGEMLTPHCLPLSVVPQVLLQVKRAWLVPLFTR